MLREIVTIDEELCDGCGQCVPACHEGALRIIDGKARLVADRLCDGLGACLGHCPRGAIRVEQREAEVFDLVAAVAPQPTRARPQCAGAGGSAEFRPAGGCPGSRFARFDEDAGASGSAQSAGAAAAAGQPSALRHWPVQLRLLSPSAPILAGASLLVAADCVPVACGEFHSQLLHGRAVVIGCPKFDDLRDYVARLADMMSGQALREVVVARMEVPCCGGLVAAVQAARQMAGADVPVVEVVVSTRGEILSERALPREAAA